MDEGQKVTWESWHRMTMGMKPSPWVTCRLIGWMLEFVIGDNKEEGNPFRWDSVILNLPGDPKYNPNLPRVYKWNDALKAIACDVKVFCDDFRIIGPTLIDTIRATHRLESRMGYLVKSRKGEVQHLHDDPMQSVFMERFMAGLQSRMPLDSQRDAPLLGHVVSAMLDLMAREVTNPNTKEKRRRLLTMTGAYMAVTYSYSLRGNEGFWVDGDSLVANIHLGRESVLDTHTSL